MFRPARSVLFLLFVLFASLSFSQGKRTVHLEQKKKGMDLYIDIPDTSDVKTFSFGVFHHVDVVSIHLEAGSELGDIYLEMAERTLSDLKNHKKHGLEQNFVKYYRESDNDLIIEYQDPESGSTYYEFHYITEIGGNNYYVCSDSNKQYNLETIMGMHKIAESLRKDK